MRLNEVIDGEKVDSIDQNGGLIVVGIEQNHLNVYKINGNELIEINKIEIANHQLLKDHKREIKIKSENRIE